MGVPDGLFGTPFWRGIWAQITLTAVWGSKVTMGFWAILGYPIWGLDPGTLGPWIPGIWGTWETPYPVAYGIWGMG